MSFNLQVKVDTSGASAQVQSFTEKLSASEQKSTDVNKALKDGLGSAAKAFGPLVAALEREQDLLERIRGPAREYMADLQALDNLLQKNAISTQEYADQVARLNQTIEKTPRGGNGGEGAGDHGGGLEIEGKLGEAVGGHFGEVGEILGGIASKGAIAAGALVGLGAEVINIGDEYTMLSNSALRLAGSQDQVNSTLHDQLELSKDIHGSLEQTIELSVAVKERTEDLGLTTKQTADFTRELAQAAELSGRSVGDATSVVERLGFMFESGLPAGRELRRVLLEFPEIAKAMKEHFGVGEKALVDMANHGKISMQSFVDTLKQADSELSEKMGGHAETLGAELGHLKDTVNVYVGQALTPMSVTINQVALEQKHLNEMLKEFPQATNAAEAAALKAIDALHKFNDALLPRYSLQDGIEALTTGMGKLLTAGVDKVVHGTDLWNRTMKDANLDAKEHIHQLSDIEKLYEEIVGPQKKLEENLVNLEILLAQGKITWQQYNDELAKLEHRDFSSKPLHDYAESLKQDGTETLRQIDEVQKSLLKMKADVVITLARDATKQWNTELETARKHAEDLGKTLEAAFKPLNAAIDELLTKGTIDFKQLGQQGLLDMTHLLEQKGESSLIAAITGRSANSAISTSKATFDEGAALANAGLTGMSAAASTTSASLGALTAAAEAASIALEAVGSGGAIGSSLAGGFGALGGTSSTIGGLGTSDLPAGAVANVARTTTVVQIGNGGYGALLPALNTTAGRQQVAQIADVRSAVQKTLKAIRPGSR